MICTQNATAGEEYRRGWHPERFTKAANADNDVLVVGAGPAGMECAMILGKRGMRRVHLVEAQDDMGGTMRWIPQLPGLGEWARIVNYRKIQIDKLKNVEFIPNRRLSAKDVAEYGAEIVVVATGSYWSTDGLNGASHAPIDGADASLAWQATPDQIMGEGKQLEGENVVIFDNDGYFMGVSLAEKLADEGKKVTLITPMGHVASYMHFTLEAPNQHRRLHKLGVEIVPVPPAVARRGGCGRGDARLRRGRAREVLRRRRGRLGGAAPLERGAVPRAQGFRRSRPAQVRGGRRALSHRRLRGPAAGSRTRSSPATDLPGRSTPRIRRSRCRSSASGAWSMPSPSQLRRPTTRRCSPAPRRRTCGSSSASSRCSSSATRSSSQATGATSTRTTSIPR